MCVLQIFFNENIIKWEVLKLKILLSEIKFQRKRLLKKLNICHQKGSDTVSIN